MNLNIFTPKNKSEREIELNSFLNLHTASLEKIAINISRFDRKTTKETSKKKGEILEVNELVMKFSDLPHLSKRIFKNLKKLKFKKPLPIQSLSFPLILKGENVICVAKTGSGKTLSFLLPTFIRLNFYYKKEFSSFTWKDCEKPEDFFKREVYTLSERPPIGASVLILVPSKELAIQIFEVAKKLGRKTQVKCAIFLSEDSKRDQHKVAYFLTERPSKKRSSPDSRERLTQSNCTREWT